MNTKLWGGAIPNSIGNSNSKSQRKELQGAQIFQIEAFGIISVILWVPLVSKGQSQKHLKKGSVFLAIYLALVTCSTCSERGKKKKSSYTLDVP